MSQGTPATQAKKPTKVRGKPVDKKAAILDAALTLFAERGFHGTTVPEVARLARVGAGTIYRYFPSKEALVNALYQHWKGRVGDQLLEEFPWDAPPRTQFGVFWKRAVGWGRGNPVAFSFLELHHHGTYLDETSRGLETRVLDLARVWFAELQQARVIKTLPADVLAAMVWSMVVAVVRGGCDELFVVDDDLIEKTEAVAWEAIRS